MAPLETAAQAGSGWWLLPVAAGWRFLPPMPASLTTHTPGLLSSELLPTGHWPIWAVRIDARPFVMAGLDPAICTGTGAAIDGGSSQSSPAMTMGPAMMMGSAMTMGRA